jgi:peptidoglycan/xylan/chitin deacetylase (PgdA/CDA1 family)
VLSSVRTHALDTVKRASVLADRVHPPDPGAVILIYHRVGARADVELDLPVPQFADQMRTLAASGRAASLDDALVALRDPQPPTLDPVVVTFDDGTADFVDDALPVLVEHQVPALLYLATGFVETDDALPYGGQPLTWSALRDALSTGLVTIGSHTHSHAVLDRLPRAAVDDELRRSCELIEDRLGVPAEHFAYPKGVATSPISDAAVRDTFVSAATGEIRTNRYGSTDLYRLGRTPIQRSDEPRWFNAKVDGGMTLEGTLRRWMNRVRYGNTTN